MPGTCAASRASRPHVHAEARGLRRRRDRPRAARRRSRSPARSRAGTSQALRSRFDAILVGRGTVEADDPQLTCRLPGLEERSPVRVVLDSDGRLATDRQVFVGRRADLGFRRAIGPRSGRTASIRRLRSVPRASRRARSSRRACDGSRDEGITRLLVEGGARVARSFLEADLVDEVMLFRSPAALGGDIVPALAGLPLSAIEASRALPPHRAAACSGRTA